jgi:hypothetical protein
MGVSRIAADDLHQEPTLASHALFTAKVMAHRAIRTTRELGRGPRKLAKRDDAAFPVVAGESVSDLWSEPHLAERRFEFGKVHNLRRALAALDGVVIPAGEEFSFWKQVGKATRRRGYVTGRMLQQGCLVPAVGGGLCQLSNALYDVALQAGCEITERHAHTRIVAGSAAAMGRDATIAWNYVDLRFRAPVDLVLEAKLTADTMIIRLRAKERAMVSESTFSRARAGPIARHAAESCGTCDKTDCFRYEADRPAAAGRTVFLVDERTPEFAAYVADAHGPNDVLGIPIDGARWRVPRYAWDTHGFARVGTTTIATLLRSFTSRRLKEQGAERRQAELHSAERLAARYVRLLAPDVTEVVVAQSLLPFLWRTGELGGRRFCVLASRLPMHLLQPRLDAAARAHPGRATLSDFRADASLVTAEREAFAAADRIVTPHAEVAALFPDGAVPLDWALPKVAVRRNPVATRIAFPGPTVARKGAYEVRETARALDLEVLLLGSELEGADFWAGVKTVRRSPDEPPYAWLGSVAAVVQPALFEERPRHLLAALAAGVPVIATDGCGLDPRTGVTIIQAGDPQALTTALRSVLSPSAARAPEPELACAS